MRHPNYYFGNETVIVVSDIRFGYTNNVLLTFMYLSGGPLGNIDELYVIKDAEYDRWRNYEDK